MTFNYILFDIDLSKKQFLEGKFEKQICKEIGISRATRHRISVGKDITMETFMKCIKWTGKEPGRYFLVEKDLRKTIS